MRSVLRCFSCSWDASTSTPFVCGWSRSGVYSQRSPNGPSSHRLLAGSRIRRPAHKGGPSRPRRPRDGGRGEGDEEHDPRDAREAAGEEDAALEAAPASGLTGGQPRGMRGRRNGAMIDQSHVSNLVPRDRDIVDNHPFPASHHRKAWESHRAPPSWTAASIPLKRSPGPCPRQPNPGPRGTQGRARRGARTSDRSRKTVRATPGGMPVFSPQGGKADSPGKRAS